jgi:thioredoxin 2
MKEFVHIVCPACESVNRVAHARLTEGPKCGTCKQPLFSARPMELQSGNFQKQIERNDIPVVVDFWAPWCGPCQMMAPTFAQATAQLEPWMRLGKLNTDKEPDIASQFRIRGIPTLIVFKDGREMVRQAGAMDLHTLVRWARSYA